jgi:hypothetical protein
VSGFDCLLIGCGASVGGSLRLHLGLLSRLRFLDGARICSDAALRAYLGLPFHLRALKRNARGIPLGFRSRSGLCRACAFRGFARARHRERAAFGFGRGTCARLVRHRERLHRSAGRHVDYVAGFRARVVRDDFLASTFALFAIALDFAPHQLGTAYVM